MLKEALEKLQRQNSAKRGNSKLTKTKSFKKRIKILFKIQKLEQLNGKGCSFEMTFRFHYLFFLIYVDPHLGH